MNHLPPTGQSAYFRARFPKSWWWGPDHDFLSSILMTLQGANWQRGGGRGDKPKRVERPREDSKLAAEMTREDLAARKQWLRQERERRARK